jgi:hypothetical protein
MHGAVGDREFKEHSYNRDVNRMTTTFLGIAERLKIVSEEVEKSGTPAQAAKLLTASRVVCFLGYGFHQLNNQRLGFAAKGHARTANSIFSGTRAATK